MAGASKFITFRNSPVLVNPPHQIYEIPVAQHHKPLSVPLVRFLEDEHPNLPMVGRVPHNAPEPVPEPLGKALPQLHLDMEQRGYHVSSVPVDPSDRNPLTQKIFRDPAF